MKTLNLALLGSGFIATHYLSHLHDQRRFDLVKIVYGRTESKVKALAEQYRIDRYTTNMHEAIESPDIDIVIVGLPNHLHLDAVLACARAGKPVLVTKPLGRNADEALQMLKAVEEAGIFHGYLEDLAYTPKTQKALQAVKNGTLGDILWVRSREAHPGPHSEWFWNKEMAGGGAIIDLGCHCVEIARNYIGKDIKPVEVMCWADTQVKPIDAEDNAIALVKYENGAIGQFEVSWAFRGGLDLRDELQGTAGTVWINHFLRTGLEMFTAANETGYSAEKADSNTGWLFPVGDEMSVLGYVQMFNDMFTAFLEKKQPFESFYDGYIVNAILDACYASAASKKWEPVNLEVWRGRNNVTSVKTIREYDENHYFIKQEQLMDGTIKLILKDKTTHEIKEKIIKE